MNDRKLREKFRPRTATLQSLKLHLFTKQISNSEPNGLPPIQQNVDKVFDFCNLIINIYGESY